MVDKKLYYQELRAKRKEAKALSEKLEGLNLEEFKKVQAVMPKMSGTGFMFCKAQMNQAGFEGLPGIDCKTFDGWKASGYKVKKGAKSVIKGLTRITSGKKDDGEDGFVFPKSYSLFHTSQVEPIGEKIASEHIGVENEQREIVKKYNLGPLTISDMNGKQEVIRTTETDDEREQERKFIQEQDEIDSRQYAIEPSHLVKTQTINFAHQQAFSF